MAPKKNTVLKLLVESWPLILSGLTIILYMRIDQIMLAQMMGNEEVGLYSAVLIFSEIWYFIPTIIVSSIIPFSDSG
jgi:PST family polysaccharide transporter